MPVSTNSQEDTSSADTNTKRTSSDAKTSSAANESSETMTTSAVGHTSEAMIDTTAITTSSKTLALEETSKAETTGPVSQAVGSTSQPVTTSGPSQPTGTTCKPSCEMINDFYAHLDDFGCDINGVFVKSDAIYTLPGEEVGATQAHWYNSNDECAEICKTLPGCLSAGFQRLSGRCFFSNTLVTREDIGDGRDSQMVHWFGMECFTCGCSSGDTSTTAFPTTTLVPEPTSVTTTTKATQSTGVCHNNRGQECEINPSNVENNDYVCIGGGVFTGETWTVPRSVYPMQENGEQCAAICNTLENCESSGFFGMENHCLFTTTKIKTSDFADPDPNYDDPGLDPKNSVWSHRSCWTCPTCVLSNAPLPKSPTCNYKPGDACTRVSADGVICNYSGMLPGTFGIDGSYPDQSSSGKCAAICRKMTGCLGSGYRNGQYRHTYDLVWDDPSCFECPGCST
uniref:Apple domain-containing protein n=1 Tax=Fusarium oxysporum (strain Fo5176) TaxID=660025 RepID=A0A0D2YER3_FUSOF